MSNLIDTGRGLGQIAAIAGLVLASTVLTSNVLTSAAFAGSCPADKVKADVRVPVTSAAVGVTDTTLGAIDLEKEPAQIKDRQLRFRKLTIAPNGIVPWHSHGDRPALIFVAEGEIVEYASNCEAPIVHKAGDIRPETSGTSHWWKNLGHKTVVLYVGDLLHDKSDKNM
jgi:quercetin dioxygenase-like cupin family protein